MTYDERPWIKSYDEGVDPDFRAPDTTYAALIETSFSDFADRPAIHFMGTTISFRELDEYTLKFASFLNEAGCEKGDVVGINMPNIPQYLIAHAGTLRAGCVATGVSPLLSAKEMLYQINDSGARVLVTLDTNFETKVTKFHSQAPRLSHIVVTNMDDFRKSGDTKSGDTKSGDTKSGDTKSGDTIRNSKRISFMSPDFVSPDFVSPDFVSPNFPPDFLPGKTVLTFPELVAKYPAKMRSVRITPDDMCLIQYTGGTTGMPKGAVLTHRNMVTNLLQSKQWMRTEPGKEVYLSAYPLFHLAGLALGMSGMCMGNVQILIADARNTNHICDQFEKYLPTYMAHVPSLYRMLLDNPRFHKLNFSRLRTCRSGAAPFAVESLRELEKVVGSGKVLEVYGMTETSPIISSNPLLGVKKIGTVGLPLQSTFVKLVDIETGTKEVPLGEEGELIVRGPQVTSGYFNKPEETAHAIRDFGGHKFLYTGDVARMDADGYMTIVDRTKDMLNVSGYKVFSREVEETLYEHPAIEVCAIVGLPDPKRPGSEIVKAVIQVRQSYRDRDHGSLEEEIISYCKENMAPYKVPKQIQFVDQVPMTSVGKVNKKALR